MKDKQDTNNSIRELYEAGFTVSDFEKIGIKIDDLKKELKFQEIKKIYYRASSYQRYLYCYFSPEELFLGGESISDIKKYKGCEPEVFKKLGVSYDELSNYYSKRRLNIVFGATYLLEKGITAKEMFKNDFTAEELKEAKYPDNEIISAGYSAEQLRSAGYDATILHVNGFNARQLFSGGYAIEELKEAKYPDNEIISAGYAVSDLKANCYGAVVLYDNNIEPAELYRCGFSLQEIKKTGTNPDKILLHQDEDTIRKLITSISHCYTHRELNSNRSFGVLSHDNYVIPSSELELFCKNKTTIADEQKNQLNDERNHVDFRMLGEKGVIMNPYPTIYSLHYYYKWDEARQMDWNDSRKKDSNSILNLKNGHPGEIAYYGNKLYEYLSKSFDEHIYLCAIPSHAAGTPGKQIIKVLERCRSFNMTIDDALIRIIDGACKSRSGTRGPPSIDYNNMVAERVVKGGTYVVVDDVTTTGASMIAANKLLKEAGAKAVYCFAFGKTFYNNY